jgi:hypothetical protein
MRFSDKRAQQEMVGFVIIVALVIIGMMIFIVISLRQTPPEIESQTAENVLTGVLRYTTDCVVSPPYFDSVKDLIQHCYENARCTNLETMACSYLNRTLSEMLTDLLINPQISGTTTAYELRLIWISALDDDDAQERLRLFRGTCNQTSSVITGTSEILQNTDGSKMQINLKICSEI